MSQATSQEIVYVPTVEEQTYPVKFLSILAEDGFSMLDKWLEEHAAPQEVKELANGLSCIFVSVESRLENPGGDWFEITSSGILQVTRGIDALGGAFHGMNSIA